MCLKKAPHSSVEAVTYEYDAWGKVLSVKNASGTVITSATHIADGCDFNCGSMTWPTP